MTLSCDVCNLGEDAPVFVGSSCCVALGLICACGSGSKYWGRSTQSRIHDVVCFSICVKHLNLDLVSTAVLLTNTIVMGSSTCVAVATDVFRGLSALTYLFPSQLFHIVGPECGIYWFVEHPNL